MTDEQSPEIRANLDRARESVAAEDTVTARRTEKYLESRACRGRRKLIERALRQLLDVEAEEYGRL